MYLVCALSILNTSQNRERVHSIFVLNLSCVVARAMLRFDITETNTDYCVDMTAAVPLSGHHRPYLLKDID